MKKVVICIEASEVMVPTDRLPGAIAEAVFPAPLRIEAEGTPPNDPDAVARLLLEREQTARLARVFGRRILSEKLSIAEAREFVAQLDLALEVTKITTRPYAAKGAPKGADERIKVVRHLADRIAREWWNMGRREITARAIAGAVADEMVHERYSSYWGSRGPMSANHIRNIALRGWKFKPPLND